MNNPRSHEPNAAADAPGPSGWRGRLWFHDTVLVDRWFPPGSRITAGESPSSSFVVPDLEGRPGAGAPALLIDGDRVAWPHDGDGPSESRPLQITPAGCPAARIELWPEPRGPRAPGAGVAWRDLGVYLVLGIIVALAVLVIASIEPRARPDAQASSSFGDGDDPIVWAMFHGPVYDPSQDPTRRPGSALYGSLSRAGVGQPGDDYDSVEASLPLPGDGAVGEQRLPPEPAPNDPEGTASRPLEHADQAALGEGEGSHPGELTPSSYGRGGDEGGLGLPGEGAAKGEPDAAQAEDADGGRGGHSDGDPQAKGRGAGVRAIERKLIGKRRFGVQFIWEGYGRAAITRGKDGGLRIAGEQRNRDGDYVTIKGTLRVVDARTILVTGTVATKIARCCGAKTQTGTFRFYRSGRRRFWRMQNPHKERFCNKYKCHYYIDLFERRG